MGNWRDNLRQVEPYVPGEQPRSLDVVKLNTNENPYPPAPGVLAALASLGADGLRRYPDPTCCVLVRELAARYGVGDDQVFVGVGSDDVLAMAFQAFFHSEKPILFPDITYAFYPVWAELFGIPYQTLALDAQFRLVKEDYYQPNGGIVFPNPNAPTSIGEPRAFVEDVVAHNPDSVVIVDEAYVDFGGESALPLVSGYDNLLVVQTFSKSRSLAGLRIGFCIGSPELIQALNAVKYSFNSYTLNEPALVLGTASLREEAYFQETLQKIVEVREEAVERLGKLGFTGPRPLGNFLFVTNPQLSAAKLFRDLREAGIYVRYFDKPRIREYLRISVGNREEMEQLYRFLEKYAQ